MKNLLNNLKNNFNEEVDIYPRREDLFQLLLPIFNEDGDMVDVYIKTCPDDKQKIRILDCGMTLMKLSYTYELNTPTREEIFDRILNNNGISNDDGNLYLDTMPDFIYQNIMQFIGCQQKLLNMRLWRKEIVRSLFFEKLEEFIESDLKRFVPQK